MSNSSSADQTYQAAMSLNGGGCSPTADLPQPMSTLGSSDQLDGSQNGSPSRPPPPGWVYARSAGSPAPEKDAHANSLRSVEFFAYAETSIFSPLLSTDSRLDRTNPREINLAFETMSLDQSLPPPMWRESMEAPRAAHQHPLQPAGSTSPLDCLSSTGCSSYVPVCTSNELPFQPLQSPSSCVVIGAVLSPTSPNFDLDLHTNRWGSSPNQLD